MNELREIEVDEVSLVDRPATGRRFVVFKRAGWLRRIPTGENKNIRSQPAAQDLAKRADALDCEIRRLAECAERLEKRLDAVEKHHPGRQSEETPSPQGGLWEGLL